MQTSRPETTRVDCTTKNSKIKKMREEPDGEGEKTDQDGSRTKQKVDLHYL